MLPMHVAVPHPCGAAWQGASAQLAHPWACPTPWPHTLPPCTQVFVRAKQQLGEVLSAFEFLDRASLEVTLEHLPFAKDPLPGSKVGARLHRLLSGKTSAGFKGGGWGWGISVCV